MDSTEGVSVCSATEFSYHTTHDKMAIMLTKN